MSSSEPKFTVIDRRGAAHVSIECVPAPQPVAAITEETRKSRIIWRKVSFLICQAQSPMGILILGKAIGLRQDGLSCCSDYVLPPVFPEHLDWVKEARRRLNTYLGCECQNGVLCATHRNLIPNWQKEDFAKLTELSSKPAPEAVEAFIKQAQAKPNLVIPR
jgi:hypothetical protein